MGGNKNTMLFHKFEILDCLKKDVGVAVYIANHIYLGKHILLKTLDQEQIPDPAMLSRFQREAKTLAQLDHPNIINVLDFGTYEQFFYISFEYFESRNLRDVFKSAELTGAEKQHVLVQLLQGLEYAHDRRIVHRDIKPENILLNKDNQLKIADFGLAHIYGEESFTQQSSIIGTPSYMSPEQIRGEELSEQTDLFSAGVVIYELYTGSNPFIGADVGVTLNNILSRQITAGKTIQPEEVRLVLDGLLKNNKKERFRSARDALSLLDIKDSTQDESAVFPERTPFRISAKVVIGIASILILFIFSIRFFIGTQKEQPIAQENQQLYDVDSLKSAVLRDSLQAVFRDSSKEREPAIAGIETDRKDSSRDIIEKNPGRLFIQCQPWAHVYIDSQLKNTTPLQDPIELKPGRYEIELKHPKFPSYVKNIRIEAEKDYYIAATLFSYLSCNIFPWGDIYLNGELLGQTPFSEPLVIAPGRHVLTVKNQEYGSIDQAFSVAPGDTFYFVQNFEQEAGI